MEMEVYKVKIVETLEMIINVKACSEKEALEMVLSDYNSEKYVLDYRNHVSTDFDISEV